ncbi:hypothetical protein PENTCL1PPCAC_7017, partial [Pristionchus entomophagus]
IQMALPLSYEKGKVTQFDHTKLLDKVRFNLHGTIITTSSSFLKLHSKYFLEFFKVNNTLHAGYYNLRVDACEGSAEVFTDLLTMLYPCKHPPIGDAEWNSKVESRLAMAVYLKIPKLVKMLLNNFTPTNEPLTNAIKAINAVSRNSKFTHLLTPFLSQFNDANEVVEYVRKINIELSDKTKILIFDYFSRQEGEPSSKRLRSDSHDSPSEAVFFDVDPAWPDARVIVMEGVSILVSTSTLALHSVVFREWFIDDRTKCGPKRLAHFYATIGLKEMTRFLSIIATDRVQDVDEKLLDAVYHLQAKHAQAICEDWIWKNQVDSGEDPINSLKIIIKVRGKYGKLDDAYVLSLAPIIFNHVEQRERIPLNPTVRVIPPIPASTTHETPLRSKQRTPSHLLTPARTPVTARGGLVTPAATRLFVVVQNQTEAVGDARAFEMSFFASLDEENRARVNRLFTQWEGARLRVIVRDENDRDHVVYLINLDGRVQDLKEELERICNIPTRVQNLLFGAQHLVLNKKLVEYGIKNGDKLLLTRRNDGRSSQA